MKLIYDSSVLIEPISENKGLTSHGYLVANNAILARTGVQFYLSQEIGMKDENKRPILDKRIKVYRLEEDVSHPEFLSSLESAPITDDHPEPEEGVTIDNHHIFAKGHGRNIRVVADGQGQKISGDLVLTDSALTKKVQTGEKVEISVGYNCRFEPYKDGYKQTNLIANHIAVVKRGRAGDKVKIYDSQPNRRVKPVFKNQKEAMAAMFAAYCKDASPEEIQAALPYVGVNDAEPESKTDVGLLAKLVGLMSAKPVKDSDEEKKTEDEDEESEKKKTEDSKIFALLDSINNRLESLENARVADADEDEDEETKTEDEDSEEDEKKKTEDSSEVLKQFAKDFKPLIAKLPEAERKKANDSLRSLLGTPAKKDGKNTYEAIHKITTAKVKDSAEAAAEGLGDEIFAQFNAHAKK